MTTLAQSAGPRADWLVEEPRWGWRSGPCQALEHTFEVCVEAGWTPDPVLPIVAPFRRRHVSTVTPPRVRYEIRSAEREGFVSAYVDGERLATGRHTHEVLGGLTWHINRAVVEYSVDRYVLLHSACAVTAGVTVILAADMESGKTTTVAGLLRDGFDYVTDEAVALDPASCQVSPFAKTLSLDPGSWPLFPECAPLQPLHARRQWHVAPSQLGATSCTGPVPSPEVVVFPKYVAGGTTEARAVSAAEATHELARMTFDFARHPGRNLAILANIAQTARCVRLQIGDLPSAVEQIQRLVSQLILDTL